jgi:hypothetical protein
MIDDCRSGRNLKTDDTPPLTGNGEQGDYHEWRLLVSDELRDAGHETDADAFWNCAADNASFSAPHSYPVPEKRNIVRVYVCEEHGVKVVRETCHLRICPDCARRAANRLLARFDPVFDSLVNAHHPRYRFRKIVLTTSLSLHDPDVAAQYLRLRNSIPKMFDELLPKNWRKSQGFIVADEFGETGEKLHFHILFYGQWIDNKERHGFPLGSAWRKVTGGDCVVTYISGILAEDLHTELMETLKYVCKFWKRDPETGEVARLSPSSMVALHKLLKHQRRVRTYGLFFRVPVSLNRKPECPDCGEEMMRMTAIEYNIWLSTGWLPPEQSLYLRTGNKSPPTARSGRGKPSGTDLASGKFPEQPPLLDKFKGHCYELPYL